MAIEIERKFLVATDEWRAQVSKRLPMHQGYLAAEGGQASMRVRVQGDEARLNIKAAVVGRSRAEYDYPMPLADAQEILDTLCVGCLQKTRYWVPFAGHTWEVDEFDGDNRGLVVAELELEAEDTQFELPPWLGEEVTDQRRYYNHALALKPYRTW